jgi:hypothetical protein
MRLEHTHSCAAYRGVDAVPAIGGIGDGRRKVAPPEATREGDSGVRPPVHEEGAVLRRILLIAVEFFVLVMVLVGIGALAISFEPLFALTYAVSYGFLTVIGLIGVAIVLWLLIAPGRSTIRAIREWSERRDVRTALRASGLAVWSIVAALVAIEMVLFVVAAIT